MYKYLPHIADVRFEAHGNTIEQVFEQAALAMFNIIIDTSLIKPEKSVEVTLRSSGLDDLLYDYLSELLYLFEVEEIIFGSFHVDSINQTDEGYTLHGQAHGEAITSREHIFDTEVKAVTYHQLKVIKDATGYYVHVIVDT
jgi:SHS2 domain-containing protein